MAIRRHLLVALLVIVSCLLVVPAWASAAEFTVNGTGDAAKGVPGISCTAALSECTLRAVIEGANESSVGTDEIKFDPAVFNGEPTDTIAPGSSPLLPERVRATASGLTGAAAVYKFTVVARSS